jgi:hypothetical protein
MRDLRKYGWRIDTSAEDATLRSNELRLVVVGEAVWSADFKPGPSKTLTASERRSALAAAAYTCALCGIGLGQAFVEHPGETARLIVKGTAASDVVCNRCAAPHDRHDEAAIQQTIRRLSPAAHARILHALENPMEATEAALLSLARRRPDVADLLSSGLGG